MGKRRPQPPTRDAVRGIGRERMSRQVREDRGCDGFQRRSSTRVHRPSSKHHRVAECKLSASAATSGKALILRAWGNADSFVVPAKAGTQVLVCIGPRPGRRPACPRPVEGRGDESESIRVSSGVFRGRLHGSKATRTAPAHPACRVGNDPGGSRNAQPSSVCRSMPCFLSSLPNARRSLPASCAARVTFPSARRSVLST